jgi:hypothetical protein
MGTAGPDPLQVMGIYPIASPLCCLELVDAFRSTDFLSNKYRTTKYQKCHDFRINFQSNTKGLISESLIMMVTVLAMCECSNYCHHNRLKLEDNRPMYCSVITEFVLKFLDIYC